MKKHYLTLALHYIPSVFIFLALLNYELFYAFLFAASVSCSGTMSSAGSYHSREKYKRLNERIGELEKQIQNQNS
jgi:hypothetical protein